MKSVTKRKNKPQPISPQDEVSELDQMELPAKYFGWMQRPWVQILDDGTAYIFDLADYGVLDDEFLEVSE